jgi:hypothetical protein
MRRPKRVSLTAACALAGGPAFALLCVGLVWQVAPSARPFPGVPARPGFSTSFFDTSVAQDPCLVAQPMHVDAYDNGALIDLDENRGARRDPHLIPTQLPVAVLSVHDLPPEHVFSSSFGSFLFQQSTDFVINLTSAAPIHGYDTRLNPQIAQHALSTLAFADLAGLQPPKIQNVINTYAETDRARGARFVLIVNSSVAGKYQTDRVVIQRTFDGACRLGVVRPQDADQAQRQIYVVVPYTGRPKRMAWFLKRFAALRHITHNRIVLVVSLHGGDEQKFREDFDIDSSATDSGILVVASSADVADVPFSRAVAIRHGAGYVPADDLMFVADIDMEIMPAFLTACRANAIQHSQVFFPVFYNLYPGERRIGANAGYWRTTSYGMSCMYRSDFDSVSAYSDAETRYAGWGREDLDLMVQFLRRPWQFSVFRAVEPGLRHRWHVKRCARNSPQYGDCMQIAHTALGSSGRLGSISFETGSDLQKHYEHLDEDELAARTSNRGS